jgi:UPF0716 protein FxsA
VVCLPLLLSLLDMTLLVQVGRAVGAIPVLLWLLAALLLGGWITRREIRRLLQGLNRQRGSDNVVRVPTARSAEFADASLGLLAGILLMLPGLLSDLVAFVLLVPFGRKLARRWIGRAATNWTTKMAARGGVVQGEIIDVQVNDMSPGAQRPAAQPDPRPLPPGGEGMPPG